MARTKSVTGQIIDLSSFRMVAGYIDDTSAWLNDIGERETIFEKMRNDGRVESLVQERKNKVLQMYGSLTATGNKAVDDACEKYLTFNVFYALNNIMLNAVPYGIAACENLWSFDGGLYVPKGFLPIPRTALSFPQSSDVPYGTPVITSLGIPLSDPTKFSLHRNDDGNLTLWGRPTLRAAYIFWKFKILGVRFWATAAEKIGCPSILALFETKNEEQAKKRAKELTNALEQWEGGSSGAFANIQSIQVIQSQINDFNQIVETCNAEIAYALTAQSLATNQAEYGTRAQSDTHTLTFDTIIKGDAYAVQQVDQRLVQAFCELNFPGEAVPSYDIDSSDFADWATIRDAIDRGVPVSLSAIYNKIHVPKPKDDADSFVRIQQNPMFFSDGAHDFFSRTQLHT